MNKNIINRVINEANYIMDTKETLRKIAKQFNVSKSTVHKDLNERLFEIDACLYNDVSSILKHHIDIRHIRGGNATKNKYLFEKSKKLSIKNM